jgi:hypothetical protein
LGQFAQIDLSMGPRGAHVLHLSRNGSTVLDHGGRQCGQLMDEIGQILEVGPSVIGRAALSTIVSHPIDPSFMHSRVGQCAE